MAGGRGGGYDSGMRAKLMSVWIVSALVMTACAERPSASNQSTAAPSAATAASPATDAGAASPAAAANESTASSSAPAVRAFIDPVTGELRAPTAQERAALAAQRAATLPEAAAKQRLAAEEVQLPNGVTEIRLGERAMHQERVCIQPDGKVTADCPAPKP